VTKRSQSRSIAMQDTITHFDGSFIHLTNWVGLIPQIPGLHATKHFSVGGCLPICSIDDNMIWILFYTCIFFVPVRLLFFFLSFANCCFAFYVSVQPRICSDENTTTVEQEYSQRDSSISDFCQCVLTDSVMDLIHLRVGGTSW